MLGVSRLPLLFGWLRTRERTALPPARRQRKAREHARGGLTDCCVRSGAGAGREVEAHEEPRSPPSPRFNPELGAPRRHELVADREPQTRTREVMSQARPCVGEGLREGPQFAGLEAAPRVADGELELRPRDGPRRYFDIPGVGELHGVGGQVQQHARERAGMADPPLWHGVHESYFDALLLGDRKDHVVDGSEHLGDRERLWCLIYVTVSAAS